MTSLVGAMSGTGLVEVLSPSTRAGVLVAAAFEVASRIAFVIGDLFGRRVDIVRLEEDFSVFDRERADAPPPVAAFFSLGFRQSDHL